MAYLATPDPLAGMTNPYGICPIPQGVHGRVIWN